MNSSNLNPRMTIIVVFAFLFIVALFISPGGTAEQATKQLGDVARTAAAKRPAEAPKPVPSSWFAAAPDDAAVAPAPPPVASAPPPQPAGAIPLEAPEPPPQGVDFPENR